VPAPQRVYREAQQFLVSGEFWESVIASSRRVFGGFALASAVGIPMGIIMGVWPPAKAFFDPLVSLLRPLPSMTWIPLTIIWFGIAETQKYAIVFVGSVIYILLYTLESTKRVDPTLIRAARNLGARDLSIMTHVILPGSLPGIIAGLKVTLAISWTCVLSAEMVAAQKGLGSLIWFAKDCGNIALVMVGMVGISLTVLTFDTIFGFFEHRILPWERNRRA
jgi:taurine transport system permease protein